jgi:hypothetical protein
MTIPKVGKEWRYGCLYCREECKYKLFDNMVIEEAPEVEHAPAVVIKPAKEVDVMIRMWWLNQKAIRKEKKEMAKLPVLQPVKVDHRALKHAIREKKLLESHNRAIQEESNRKYFALLEEQKAIPFSGPFHAESRKQIYGVKRQGIVRDALRAVFQIKKILKPTSKKAVHHERMEVHKMSPLSRVDNREYSKEEMNYFLALSLKEIRLNKADREKVSKLPDGRYHLVTIEGVRYLQKA